MDFSGKQVAVIGYGKSGKAALELLGKLGAKRILYDQKLDCNAPGIDAEVLVSGDFKEARKWFYSHFCTGSLYSRGDSAGGLWLISFK